MNQASLIETHNLSLRHFKKQILSDISIQIHQNDFISLIGPNGAGKSMLIQCLLKFQAITSGKIDYRKNLKIGYVPQKLDFEPSLPLKVIDFIKLKEEKDKNTKDYINQLIEEFKLSSYLNDQMTEISGGQLQKTFLLKSLVGKPDLLILDEPEKNLDINSRIDFYEKLNQIYSQFNLAILIASHELNFVMNRTKKVICLFSHICCTGEPEFVAKDPKFIELFGEKMAKNFALYRHHQHHHSHHH